jgi:hypothetical protein
MSDRIDLMPTLSTYLGSQYRRHQRGWQHSWGWGGVARAGQNRVERGPDLWEFRCLGADEIMERDQILQGRHSKKS